MNDYYRITGYCEKEDFCFIMDCYGKFEKLWQFSSFLLQKGFTICEAGNESKFFDGNMERVEEKSDKIYLRAGARGLPEQATQTIAGVTYRAIKVDDRIYVPDRTKTMQRKRVWVDTRFRNL